MTSQLAVSEDRKEAGASPPKPRGLPLLLRNREAAYELSCSLRTVYNLINLGLLERVEIGERMPRITSRSVRRLAANRSRKQVKG
jgi:hypothetical protein